MWLDELSELVDALAKRINEHQATLSRSEAATRYGLIDPLLRALGWDLSDPNQVRPEYRTESEDPRRKKRADYAMLHQNEPYLIVEAKKLDEQLSDDAQDQLGTYLLRTSAQYGVVTNGRRWVGYSLDSKGDKKTFEFNVTRSPASVLELLWLWRGNMMGATVRPKSHRRSDASSVSVRSSAPSAPAPSQSGIPLPNVEYSEGMPPPKRLLFPDGAMKDVSKSWAAVQVAIAEWLFDCGRVSDLPLKNSRGTHLASSEPTTAKGKDFRSGRKVRDGFWIDMNFGPASHLRKAKELLLACDVRPETVTLELS